MNNHLQKNWVRQILTLALGAISSFAMQPYEVWPLLVFGLSGFWLLLTMAEKPWQPWLSGFLFGFGYFVAGLWWVGNALLVDGNPYLWALPAAVFGLQAILAMFIMVAAGLSQRFSPGRTLRAFVFFIAMVAFWEWGRGRFFTGFPWNLFGMTWTGSLPMAQLSSIGGIHLLNLLTIFAFTLPAFLWRGKAAKKTKIILGSLTALILIAGYSWGFYRIQANPVSLNRDVVVQIVTPNIAQSDKWNPALSASNFYKTVQLMHPSAISEPKAGKARAIILPETALLPEVFQSPEAVNALRVAANAYPENTYILSGALRREEDESGNPRYFNSLAAFDKAGTIRDWFDKFHLVPFGEYMPFQKYIPFGPVAKFAGFQGGKGPETWTQFDGLPPFSPLICYEIIFAGAVTNQASPPAWMVNVTNDAWYGVSPGPYQHLAQTQFRAIEEGIPVVRSTNTGISALIDPVGRLLTQSPLYENFVQEEYLPNPVSSPTLYSRYKDKIFFFSLAFLCLPFLFRRKN